jgi:hypothetical protein
MVRRGDTSCSINKTSSEIDRHPLELILPAGNKNSGNAKNALRDILNADFRVSKTTAHLFRA